MGKVTLADMVRILLVTCLTSAAAFSQQVSTGYKRGTNFSNYKTYAWGTSPHPINDPLWNQRIMETVDGALAAKGMQRVNLDQNPSVIVVYSAGIRVKVTDDLGSSPAALFDYSRGIFYRMGQIYQVVEIEGTLAVAFRDSQTKMITWRGIATEALSDKSQKNSQKLQKMVSKMFQKYPPSD